MTTMTVNEIKKHFTTHSIKASLPRVKIFEYLIKHRSHPTIDEIFSSLSEELITLSKTTVYNTLDLFVKNKIAIQILIEDNEVRYDADVSNHGHFKCSECGSVFDFKYDLAEHNIPNLEGFDFVEYHTYIKGICKKCK